MESSTLKFHPLTGLPLMPIGYRKDGRPIMPILGAEDAPPEGEAKTEGPPKFEPITSQEEMDKRLGERLARERAKVQGQFADYADLKAKADAHDKTVEDAKTQAQKDIDKAREEGKSEGATAGNARLISAEARALAAELKFASPALVVKALDLAGIKIADDGEVDSEAIKAKLKELADSGAFVIDDGAKPKPKPDKAQGRPAGKGDASVAAGREMFANRRGAKKTT